MCTVELLCGELSFKALSGGRGTTVILLHGFPDNAGTYHRQLPALIAAGYRVLVPTMRGYEISSQPREHNYHVLHMARDVISWLNQQELDKVHLVGHDWGSAVAQTAAALAPERFHTLSLLAVPNMIRWETDGLKVPRQILNSWYMLFFQLPLLSDWIVRRNQFSFLEFLWRKWSPGWIWPPEVMSSVKETFGEQGVVAASLGYYRQNLNRFSGTGRDLRDALKGGIHVPTLALTGEDDGCINSEVFRSCMRKEDFPAGLSVKIISGAGHFLHQEDPKTVNTLLLDWLDKYSDVTDN